MRLRRSVEICIFRCSFFYQLVMCASSTLALKIMQCIKLIRVLKRQRIKQNQFKTIYLFIYFLRTSKTLLPLIFPVTELKTLLSFLFPGSTEDCRPAGNWKDTGTQHVGKISGLGELSSGVPYPSCGGGNV